MVLVGGAIVVGCRVVSCKRRALSVVGTYKVSTMGSSTAVPVWMGDATICTLRLILARFGGMTKTLAMSATKGRCVWADKASRRP